MVVQVSACSSGFLFCANLTNISGGLILGGPWTICQVLHLGHFFRHYVANPTDLLVPSPQIVISALPEVSQFTQHQA